jgi:PAS domain S-box-containing protein
MSIKKSMRFYSLLIIAIFLIMSVGSVLLISFYRDKARAEALEKHEKELEKYAGELEEKVNQRTGELTTEKEKLNTIVSAIGNGIMLVDNQEVILWVNQTMKDIAGRDLTGTHCREIFTDYSVISSYEENDMQTAVLSNLFGKSDRCFQVTTAPVRADDGGVHGYIKMLQDVTELKRQEEQMMHSEKLACLGRLTAGIAHEIGNPLTSVFSFIQVLKNMEKDEFKKETIDTIYFHMNSIADILTQLSAFSKIPPMELKPAKVNSLIEETLSLIQYDRRTQDITIIKDLASDIPEITTDASQLSHVLVNMVLNAADAMPDGGTLTIRSRARNNSVVIDFEDTGVGIDSNNLSKVFDPLYTTKEKGTGLGLAVSNRIIKKLHGSISVESEPGKGSKFVITIPAYITI